MLTKEQVKNEEKNLKQVIEEKTLLKTKVKLLHILYFDQDLITLENEGLTILDLNLEDLYLTEGMHLIVPVADKIIPIKENDLKLRSYLIYLSYLYNFDFLSLYFTDKALLWDLACKLQISTSIKENLYHLLKGEKRPYFSTYLEELNNAEYRDSLKEDTFLLQRSVKH